MVELQARVIKNTNSYPDLAIRERDRGLKFCQKVSLPSPHSESLAPLAPMKNFSSISSDPSQISQKIEPQEKKTSFKAFNRKRFKSCGGCKSYAPPSAPQFHYSSALKIYDEFFCRSTSEPHHDIALPIRAKLWKKRFVGKCIIELNLKRVLRFPTSYL